MIKIEIKTDQKEEVLQSIFDQKDLELGHTKTIEENTELVFLRGNEDNMLGTGAILLLAKIATFKLSADAKAVILSVIANVLYESLKSIGKKSLYINDKEVGMNEQAIKEAVRAVLEEQIQKEKEEE